MSRYSANENEGGSVRRWVRCRANHGAVVADLQSSVGFGEMVVAQEGLAGPSESRQIGTGMAEHPLLPEIVETLDVGVAPRFPRRDEQEMDAQEQMQRMTSEKL